MAGSNGSLLSLTRSWIIGYCVIEKDDTCELLYIVVDAYRYLLWNQKTPSFLSLLLVVQLLSHIRLFTTPWTTACQAPLPSTVSQSLFKFMSIESVMPSNHFILCCPLLSYPSLNPTDFCLAGFLPLKPVRKEESSFSSHLKILCVLGATL